jgi:hypothetical protein
MRFYLVLAILFILVIWDIAQNNGYYVRAAGAWFSGLMRGLGLM